MAGNLFGKLGGGLENLGGALGDLVTGISKTVLPKDDPDVKVLEAQQEINGLKKQETELFTEIGRQAFAADAQAYPQGEKLVSLQAEIAAAEERLNVLIAEREKAKQAKEAAENAALCPACGHRNQEGVKFCQECGAKLGKTFCSACGAELAAGARFCGSCGQKQGE
ncbi:MAG: zinc ribbon domain-containing protein [Candidatus Accumulibacter sp.]|jgi:formate dehydrogenase maturation protein FdhE|nr:zinc ribbon domain-containing protein [Accumulibacter sp.]